MDQFSSIFINIIGGSFQWFDKYFDYDHQLWSSPVDRLHPGKHHTRDNLSRWSTTAGRSVSSKICLLAAEADLEERLQVPRRERALDPRWSWRQGQENSFGDKNRFKEDLETNNIIDILRGSCKNIIIMTFSGLQFIQGCKIAIYILWNAGFWTISLPTGIFPF